MQNNNSIPPSAIGDLARVTTEHFCTTLKNSGNVTTVAALSSGAGLIAAKTFSASFGGFAAGAATGGIVSSTASLLGVLALHYDIPKKIENGINKTVYYFCPGPQQSGIDISNLVEEGGASNHVPVLAVNGGSSITISEVSQGTTVNQLNQSSSNPQLNNGTTITRL